MGVSLRSDVFKGISFSDLFLSSSPYLDFLSVLLFFMKTGERETHTHRVCVRESEKERDIDKYF